MEKITLEQDAADKIKITLSLYKCLMLAQVFFKWRKNITPKRINSLGTAQRDKFIKYLHNVCNN